MTSESIPFLNFSMEIDPFWRHHSNF